MTRNFHLGTYCRTVRHLRLSQIAHLASRRVLRRKASPAKHRGPVALAEIAGRMDFAEWQPAESRQMLATREFTFLNQNAAANASVPWNDRRYAKLWLYHLNYCDFMNLRFNLPHEDALLERALEIALDWCRRNSEGNEVGWEPYPLSMRIVNWLKLLERHAGSQVLQSKNAAMDALVQSLGAQAATLERRLEKDLLGNHFLKNIKALLFAGALLETPLSSRWWARGEKLLERELKEQILPDGGHFERSPMYHSQVLEDVLDIQVLCAAAGRRLHCAGLLESKIGSMKEFLQGILHADGEIPLFNDAVLGGARPPAEVLAGAAENQTPGPEHAPQLTLFPHTGYGVIRCAESKSSLIFDCGPLGPNYQPGHGHCDVLSYELSLDGQRVVVDSGVSTYERAPERFYERSTAAHNTIRIDGQDQAEVWASFRVGRRPRVGKLQGGAGEAPPSDQAKDEPAHAPFCFLKGEHYGYERRGVVHARMIVRTTAGAWIVADLLKGSGCHRAESFVHFHPAGRIRPRAEGSPSRHRWILDFAHQSYSLVTYGRGEFSVFDSWYSEQFGKRRACKVLRWVWVGRIPKMMVYAVVPDGAATPSVAADARRGVVEINGHRLLLR